MFLSDITSKMTNDLFLKDSINIFSIKSPINNKKIKKIKKNNVLKTTNTNNLFNSEIKRRDEKYGIISFKNKKRMEIFNLFKEDVLKKPKNLILENITQEMDNDITSDEELVNRSIKQVIKNLQKGITKTNKKLLK